MRPPWLTDVLASLDNGVRMYEGTNVPPDGNDP
jgi:hypothetical protein